MERFLYIKKNWISSKIIYNIATKIIEKTTIINKKKIIKIISREIIIINVKT
jgi:hypothetical protein